jgi:replicative DNA helicase
VTDSVLLKGELSDRGELEAVGGPAYLSSLCDGVPLSASVDHYAARVREKAWKRRLQEQAHLLTKACANGHDLPELVEAGGALYRAALQACQ